VPPDPVRAYVQALVLALQELDGVVALVALELDDEAADGAPPCSILLVSTMVPLQLSPFLSALMISLRSYSLGMLAMVG